MSNYNDNRSSDAFQRYARQIRFAPLGPNAQQSLASARVLVCGCGALGSVLAETLGRAGVGYLRLVDRDFVDLSNLQRQVLYDEADVAKHLPKAVAAAEHLRQINSQITIEPCVTDLQVDNVRELLSEIDLIVDGTDNFETRLLLNDAALQLGIPWIFGGCVGAQGQTMTIVPGWSPCFRCLVPSAPPPGSFPTCDMAGVLGPIVNVIASIQACEALKILTGQWSAVSRHLTVVDLWENRWRTMDVTPLGEEGECPACRRAEFEYLAGTRTSQTAVLCGRNAVQIRPEQRANLSLEQLAQRLQSLGEVTRNDYLLRFTVEGFQLTVFPDGRAIIVGTEEVSVARGLYARYLGN